MVLFVVNVYIADCSGGCTFYMDDIRVDESMADVEKM